MCNDPGLLDEPALIAHLSERARKRRCNSTHEVMNLLSRPGPIDPAVLGAATSEVLTLLRRLGVARCRSRNQSRQRTSQYYFRRHGHLAIHGARIVVLQNRYGELVDNITRIRTLDHVMERGARLPLTMQDRPIHRRAAAISGQQRAMHIERAQPGCLQQWR